MAFFIKAQLTSFSHDKFRAAWSGLNALYTQLCIDGNEQKKINALATEIRENKAGHQSAERFISELPEAFWIHLRWGLLLRKDNRHYNDIVKKIRNNTYADSIVFKYLAACYLSLIKKSQIELYEPLKSQFEAWIRNKKKNSGEQLCFLVTEYCYLLRNRSFHAAQPYPVFELHDREKDNEDRILSDILLTMIIELIPVV